MGMILPPGPDQTSGAFRHADQTCQICFPESPAAGDAPAVA
jgi:hypothetical protein